MTRIHRVICPLVALFVAASRVVAGNTDVEIHCVPKKLDEAVKKASDGGANTTKEHWRYEVTVENKTFKELGNLEVKYAIFLKQEQLGTKSAPTPRHQNGSFSIPGLKPHEKKAFTTDSVELTKSNLVGNWIYSSGAKINAQDTLVGLVMKMYQNGQQFAEYGNPSTLTREKWE
jgi:hypothetical protein